jgi:hypothetical protein
MKNPIQKAEKAVRSTHRTLLTKGARDGRLTCFTNSQNLR